jgi:hypothetical protein
MYPSNSNFRVRLRGPRAAAKIDDLPAVVLKATCDLMAGYPTEFFGVCIQAEVRATAEQSKECATAENPVKTASMECSADQLWALWKGDYEWQSMM